MNKATIIFCEGDHDIAFLVKLLSIYGYAKFSRKISEFPDNFKSIYLEVFKETTVPIENRVFAYQQRNFNIPHTVLSKNDSLFIFHNLAGDGEFVEKSNEVIKSYSIIKSANKTEIPGYRKELSLKFLYFLDADEMGVEKRLNQLKTELNIDEMEHCKVFDNDEYELGCYIFHNDQDKEKKGKLEDILLQLMQPENENLFGQCESFLKDNALEAQRTKEYRCVDNTYGRSRKYKHQKSIIAVAGQLQFSGMNNAAIIRSSDFIKREDLENNTCCRNIMQLFQEEELSSG